MPAKAYILVPNDGNRETVLNAQDVRKMPIIENNEAETRLSGLMDQRGINVPFWLTNSGVMIYGDGAQARAVGNLVESFPSLVPSRSGAAPAVDNDDRGPHISMAFEHAASRYMVAPARLAFNEAANDPSIRPVVPASRPNIRGGYNGLHAA